MGSPLSPIIADIYIEFLEIMALDKADLSMATWKRHLKQLPSIYEFSETIHPVYNGNRTQRIFSLSRCSCKQERQHLKHFCIPRIKTGIVQCLKHRAHALSHHEFTVRIWSPTKGFPFKWLSQTVDHTMPSQEESTTTSNIRQIHSRKKRQEIPCSTIYQRPKWKNWKINQKLHFK